MLPWLGPGLLESPVCSWYNASSMSCSNKLTAWRCHPQVLCIFSCGALKDAIRLGFFGKEVLLVVRVVQAHLVAAFLDPEGRAVKPTTEAGRLGSVEILRVAHRIAMGILIMQVSSRSWMQGLIVIDWVLHRASRPLGNRLVYIFRHGKECVIYVVLCQDAGGIGAIPLQEGVFFDTAAPISINASHSGTVAICTQRAQEWSP